MIDPRPNFSALCPHLRTSFVAVPHPVKDLDLRNHLARGPLNRHVPVELTRFDLLVASALPLALTLARGF